MPDRVVLTIGTRKGLFVAESAKARGKFALRGPFASGVAVYSSMIDTRSAPRIYASSCNPFFGMKVLRSTDLGKTFKETKSAPAFPKDDGRALANIWSLEPGAAKGEIWCGVEPASLFRSRDNGDSWQMVDGISNHAHARKWQPGAGGLCLHTILRDGNRMHLGISTGGHYVSEDGGETFNASNSGVGAGFTPDPYPEFGQCVHKIVGHKDAPGRLYMQNHGGWGEWDGPGGRRPGHRRAAKRRLRPHMEVDREGTAIRLWIPDRRAPARSGYRLRDAAHGSDAHLSRWRARRMAQ